MRKLMTVNSSAEAHMIVHMLEAEGLKAEVQGDFLQGGVGELPASGHIQIAIADEDYRRAKEILEVFEKAQPVDYGDHKDREMSFKSIFLAFIMFICGIFFAIYNLSPKSADYLGRLGSTDKSYVDSYDYNHDGLPDHKWTISAAGVTVKSETDRNYDGEIDHIAFFSENGLMKEAQSDDNFDGHFEITTLYDDLTHSRMKIDRDHDGVMDYMTMFQSDVPTEMYYYDQDISAPVKIDFYKGGYLDHAHIDTDRDGRLDTVHYYDRFYEVTSVSELK